ncbi:DUF2945 domain-containing protein [Nesterenkonia pannonica]|uniref:DUF2945 domain-containing protein n=1 Tax=Nesterenkonia pannonica TaxID=1548602 RepID=UPI002164BC9E|nr:DUF2945 domain-containing protein [Nesterenkonia pannonica]
MSFKKGQRVSWSTSQGTTCGTVVSKHTEDLTFADQTFRSSADDPVYIVESEKTGKQASHHEKALEG